MLAAGKDITDCMQVRIGNKGSHGHLEGSCLCST